MDASNFRLPVVFGILAVCRLGLPEQAPAQAPPPAPPATLWQYLGIPQTINGVLNARGNHPRFENKPPLKRIGDPELLKVDNPAIKAAAQIKIQEDLAEQKIKAIKYLATIGCGCYDKKIDPPVKDALIAALEDCTERVRFAAAQAVAEAACTKCRTCSQNCCCDQKMADALAKVAYEKGDDGCWLEPSARVRTAAREALFACCRNRRAPYGFVPTQQGNPGVSPGVEGPKEVVPDDKKPEVIPIPPIPQPNAAGGNGPATEGQVLTDATRAAILDAYVVISDDVDATKGFSAMLVPVVAPSEFQQSAADRRISVYESEAFAAGDSSSEIVATPSSDPALQLVSNAAEIEIPQVEEQPQMHEVTVWKSETRNVRGSVKWVKIEERLIAVQFSKQAPPVVGAQLKIFHEYLFGTELLGTVEVAEVQGSLAIARLPNNKRLLLASPGDSVSSRFEVPYSETVLEPVPPGYRQLPLPPLPE